MDKFLIIDSTPRGDVRMFSDPEAHSACAVTEMHDKQFSDPVKHTAHVQ